MAGDGGGRGGGNDVVGWAVAGGSVAGGAVVVGAAVSGLDVDVGGAAAGAAEQAPSKLSAAAAATSARARAGGAGTGAHDSGGTSPFPGRACDAYRDAVLEPEADRPYMPGYGITASPDGEALLPWSWALERLQRSHDYWVATVTPDGRPHVMPVWGAWRRDGLWFSSANGSRKARNLRAEPRCSVTTDDASEPVVLEGTAHRVEDLDEIAAFAADVDGKYDTDYGAAFYEPSRNSVFALTPTWAFALAADRFTDSPTRWTFTPSA
jgi:PPOX class probable F420-dependent enzyme